MLDSPNDFDVYLHDTPGKQLFRSSNRAASNGCIRVEAILQLAALALGDGDAEARVTEAIAARDMRRIELSRPLPVYFLYWTAIAAPDGTVGFRRDVYDRDAPLIAALAAPTYEANATEPARELARVGETLPIEIEASWDREPAAEVSP
jgi:murein L,D-transpeptidase YcbB/YkuD